MPIQVIVNADDLGLSQEVNDAVFTLMSEGRVTSATILANGPALADAARKLGSFPHCSFGAHLNLTELVPLAPSPELKPLLDARGQFSNTLRRARITSGLRRAVCAEWRAQVSKLRELGVPLSHLDSHHHAHTTPGLLPVLKRIQAEFGIRRVRRSKNLYANRRRPSWRLCLGKALWNLALRAWYPTRTTRIFTSLQDFLENDPQYLARYPSFELMVHPGATRFATESAALNTPWREQLGFATRLINYHSL
jgi:predicted glycoside hydrolase/deacetylase ChbG (UPF0249 family)